jgi:hypothetical protein
MSHASHVEANDREHERLRALVASLSDADLLRAANAEWTVAEALGHMDMALWDARALWLAEKAARGEPFGPGDVEPPDVTWVNEAARPLIRALPPRAAAELALELAEAVDRAVAALPAERLWPMNPASPLNAFRAEHRGEHLDEIEAALA